MAIILKQKTTRNYDQKDNKENMLPSHFNVLLKNSQNTKFPPKIGLKPSEKNNKPKLNILKPRNSKKNYSTVISNTPFASKLQKGNLSKVNIKTFFTNKDKSAASYKNISNKSYKSKNKNSNINIHNIVTNLKKLNCKQLSKEISIKSINTKSKKKVIVSNTNNYINNINIFLEPIFENLNDKKIFFKADSKILFNLNKNNVTPKMRLILFDWIHEISNKLKLKLKTTALIFELIDIYFTNNTVSKNKYQLLGITCLFIASKYEEIEPAQLSGLVELCNDYYTCYEILDMEKNILEYFNFKLTFPSRLDFYYLFCRVLNVNNKMFYFGHMLLDVVYLSSDFYIYDYDLIAFSLLYLVFKIFKVDNFFDKKVINNKLFFFGTFNLNNNNCFTYNENIVKRTAMEIYEAYKIWDKNEQHLGIKKKYLTEKYSEVSKYKIIKYNN